MNVTNPGSLILQPLGFSKFELFSSGVCISWKREIGVSPIGKIFANNSAIKAAKVAIVATKFLNLKMFQKKQSNQIVEIKEIKPR